MIARRGVSVTLVLIPLLIVFGCGREKAKNDFQLGQENFHADKYPDAKIRLDRWIRENPDSPENTEAHAMLAVVNYEEGKQEDFDKELAALKKIGEPGMLAVLKLLEDPDMIGQSGNSIRKILVKGGETSLGPLIHYLKEGMEEEVRNFSLEVLIQMGPLAVGELTKALDDPDLKIRIMAVDALTRIGDKRAVEPLKRKLNDPSKIIQIKASTALHKMGQMNAESIIISALRNDKNGYVRGAAAKAAVEVLNSPPVPVLLKAMEDPVADVRKYAAIGLGKARSPEAIKPLVKALTEDTSDEVRNAAAQSLKDIDRPVVESLIEALKSTKKPVVIKDIANILGDIAVGDRQASEALREVYKKASNDKDLQGVLANAINKIDYPQSQ